VTPLVTISEFYEKNLAPDLPLPDPMRADYTALTLQDQLGQDSLL